ncbi:MAG: hypothetical protein ABIQ70_11115 [Dokdonella sp.]
MRNRCRGISRKPPRYRTASATCGFSRAWDSRSDDQLHFSIALAKSLVRNDRIEVAPAHTAIDLPAYFHFFDRYTLNTSHVDADNSRGDDFSGWPVG